MRIRKLNLDEFQDYGDYRYAGLYPWEGVARTPFGSGWTHLAPGQLTKQHQHHELETYFVAYGRGAMTVDDETVEVGPGDVIFMPPFFSHELRNTSETEDLLFLSVYWEDMSTLDRNKEEVLEAAGETPRAPRRVAVAASAAGRRDAGIHARYLAQRGVEVVSKADAADAADLVDRLRGLTEPRGSRLVFPLAPHAEALRDFHLAAKMGPEVRAVCDRRLAEGLGEADLVVDDLPVVLLAGGLDAGTVVCGATEEEIVRHAVLHPALLLAAGVELPPLTWIAAREEAVDDDFSEHQAWLGELGRRLDDEYGGKVPCTGLWTEEQRRFYDRLKAFMAAAGDAHEAATFSPAEARHVLDEIVRAARRFARREAHWIGAPNRGDERRTSLALELAAAKVLAMAAAPLAPGFARAVWHGLGYDGEPAWEPIPDWVPMGRRIPAGHLALGQAA